MPSERQNLNERFRCLFQEYVLFQIVARKLKVTVGAKSIITDGNPMEILFSLNSFAHLMVGLKNLLKMPLFMLGMTVLYGHIRTKILGIR